MFTEEQITQLKEVIDKGDFDNEAIKPLKELGFRTNADLEKMRESVEEDQFKKATSEIYKRLDDDFKQLGFENSNRKKTYEHLKDVLSNFKITDEKAKTLEAQLEELKQGGKVNEHIQKEYEELKAKYQETNILLEQERQSKEKELQSFKEEVSIRDAFSGIKFKSDIDDSIINAMKENAINKIKSMNKQFVEGKMIFLKDDGTTLKNDKTYDPVTADELVKQLIGAVIENGKQQPGTGTKAPEPGNFNSEVLPGHIKTKVQLTSYLREQGIAQGTKEHTEYFNKHSVNLPFK